MEEMYTMYSCPSENAELITRWDMAYYDLIYGKATVDYYSKLELDMKYWLENSKGERVYPKEISDE